MKLRIKGNSIRLRLGRSEVQRLAITGEVEESTDFGPSKMQRFGYAIRASPEHRGVSVSLADCRIVIHVRNSIIQEWATTDQVGIDALQHTGDDGGLRILIEKDFECIDAAAGESQEDAFPHPQFGRACLPANTIARLA